VARGLVSVSARCIKNVRAEMAVRSDGNDLGDEVEISWQASDVDDPTGEGLSYILYYGEAGDWSLFDTEITESTYLLNTSSEGIAGGDYNVKIIASDGFNEGELISSETFFVPKKPPFAGIYFADGLSEDDNIFVGMSVMLGGYAYDPEDGDLDIEWKLNSQPVGSESFLRINSFCNINRAP